MAANVSTPRSAAPSTGADPGPEPVNRSSTWRRVAVVAGLILLPLGAIILACVPLLQARGGVGAVLVVGGASVLAAGIGLLALPAHAEHVRSYGVDRLGRSRR